MKYIASWSGGKDSTASIILAHEHNEPLDLIIFSEVMFDENISGELPEHIDFIKNKAIPVFESWGYETKIFHSNKTYTDCFYQVQKRSRVPERIGKRWGFPMPGKCMINSQCKIRPIKKFWKEIKEPFTQYIGIAIDEPKRMNRIVKAGNNVSLLEKYGYTEQMAFDLCKEYGLLSPIYEFAPRNGCWFCPNTRCAQLKRKLENMYLFLSEALDFFRLRQLFRKTEDGACYKERKVSMMLPRTSLLGVLCRSRTAQKGAITMTENEESKKVINGLNFLKEKLYNGIYADRLDCIDYAISALKEIQQYREIGTVEEWREAREKQTPKTDKFRLKISGALNMPCPNCGKCVELHKKGVIYCENCGQALQMESDSTDQ